MAVKVIKYGKMRRVTCGHCRSLLEYEKGDTKTKQAGMNEWERYITCPVCGEDVREEGVGIKQEITCRMRF